MCVCSGIFLYHEKYRPQYHFSPSKGWVGDPSGLMYYQGKYHLYWWGKAESKGLGPFGRNSRYNDVEVGCYPFLLSGFTLIDKSFTKGDGQGVVSIHPPSTKDI